MSKEKKKERKIKKLGNYFLSAPQTPDSEGIRRLMLWEKVEEIINCVNETKPTDIHITRKNLESCLRKHKKEILIEVSRMIEERTGA